MWRLHGRNLPRLWFTARIRRRLGGGLILAGLAAATGCGWTPQQKAIGYAYAGPSALNLRADLGLRAPTIETLSHGDRLEILETKRRFVKVRTESGAIGWTDSSYLLTQSQMDDLTRLNQRAAQMPSQGAATVFDTLNVHISASRTAPSFVQLEEGDPIEVLAHRVTERGGDATRPADDWFLVRTPEGRAGWVLSRMVLMTIPDEVAQYANGHYIMAYHPLGEAPGPGPRKFHWLWATAAHARQPFDFDSLRVFVYNPRTGSYGTVFVERNLKGFYPLELTDVPGESGQGFSAVVEEKDGTLVRRTYLFNGARVKLIGKQPYAFPPPLPEVGTAAKAFDTHAPHEKTWAEKVREFASWWLGI